MGTHLLGEPQHGIERGTLAVRAQHATVPICCLFCNCICSSVYPKREEIPGSIHSFIASDGVMFHHLGQISGFRISTEVRVRMVRGSFKNTPILRQTLSVISLTYSFGLITI